jgi:5'-nucleotidase
MRILVSNDDGYQAPGIVCLAKTLSEIAEVTIVAPDRNRSGASNSLTLDVPLHVRQYQENGYYVNGTPTDCVHLAVTGLLGFVPDMVISGINDGENLGDDILYSGTVAAATEGRNLGLPSIAVSLAGNTHFQTAANVAKIMALRLSERPTSASTVLNVNVPDVPMDALGTFEITRLGTRHPAEKALKRLTPRGREVYWIGLPGAEQDSGPGTDFCALHANNVSITPLKFDLTHYDVFDQLSTWMKDFT